MTVGPRRDPRFAEDYDLPFPVTMRCSSRIPRWLGVAGITLRRTVLLAPQPIDCWTDLVAHEMRHVMQWHELGTVRFLWRYFREWLRHGYGPEMPLESDAIWYARTYRHLYRELLDEMRAVQEHREG